MAKIEEKVKEIEKAKEQEAQQQVVVDTRDAYIRTLATDGQFAEYIVKEIKKEIAVNDTLTGLLSMPVADRDTEMIARTARVEVLKKLFKTFL